MNPLAIYPGGYPWRHWSIAGDDTNTYFLSGTLYLFTRTNFSPGPQFKELQGQVQESYHKLRCRATLEFPKAKIAARTMDSRKQAK